MYRFSCHGRMALLRATAVAVGCALVGNAGAAASAQAQTPLVEKAFGKPVVSSSFEKTGLEGSKGNDGSVSTRWSSAWTDGQWWQVDLGGDRAVSQVKINWEYSYAPVYRISTSSDGQSWTTAAEQTASAPGEVTTSFASRTARYVRVTGLKRAYQWGISFWEAKVLGPAETAPAPTPTPTPTPLKVESGDFVIAPNGSDANSGTASSPWRTIAKAASALQAGQRVFVRAGTYSEALNPARSGTASAPITFAAYPGEKPILSLGAGIGINLSNRSHVVVDGLTVEANGKAQWLSMVQANRTVVRNSTFRNASNSGHGAFLQDASYNQLTKNNFANHGNGVYGGTDAVKLYRSNNNLFAGNRVVNASHATFQILGGSYNVVRDNYIQNDYGQAAEVHDGPNGTPDSRHNVWDGNVITAPNWGIDGKASPGLYVASARQIIRRNVVRGSQMAGIHLEGFASDQWSGSDQTFQNRIYNNTSYGNGKTGRNSGIHENGMGGLSLIRYQSGPQMYGNEFVNNISYGNRQGGTPIQVMAVDWGQGGLLNEQRFTNNLIMGSAGVPSVHSETNIGRTVNTLAWWQSRQSSVFARNLEADPAFVNEAGMDFRLSAASPAIDAGAPLTRTSAAGASTRIPVQDALAFSDGFSITDGDLVRVGANAVARVTAVDYAGKAIVLDRSVTFSAGDLVRPQFNGTAPDIGAFES